MKKIISLVLAAVLTLSLAACGTKNDSKGDQPAAPASALDLLEKVWSTYTDDEKFPASGRVPDPHDEPEHLHRRGVSLHR